MIRGSVRGETTRGIVLQLFQQVGDLLHLLIKFNLFFALTVRLGHRQMCIFFELLVLSSDLLRTPLNVRTTMRFLRSMSSTPSLPGLSFTLLSY